MICKHSTVNSLQMLLIIPLTGNLLRRRDNNHSASWEEFTYDSLDRLISAGGQEVRYALNGNLLGREEDETMTYGTGDHSYQVTGYSALITPTSLTRSQSISYTSYDRPLQITESSIRPSTSKTARFTYGSGGERVRMVVTNSADTLLTRYYIGERYERDEAVRETVKRLYLGGDAYSAPMVLCKVSGSWKVYQIGRDYLGSITQIIDEDGEVIEENSYDPWGRRRDVSTHTVYAPDAGPDLFLGRGYTSHEHLPWFGLVNMNARLYDPLVGRFLSPDPYVQAPDFTQNFNRYSYALNNPLKYSDESGELFGIDDALIMFSLSAAIGAISGAFMASNSGAKGALEWSMYIAGGAFLGAITAGWASGVSGIVASSTSLGGFFGGLTAGLAGGAVGGGLSGFSFSLMAGANFSSAFNGGLSSAWKGAISGGLLGGLSNGIRSSMNEGNFWTGNGELIECFGSSSQKIEVGEGMEYSNDYAKRFSDNNFGTEIKGVANLYADGSLPNRGEYIVKGDHVYRMKGNQLEETFGTCHRLGNGKTSNVYLYKSAFVSKEQLYLTMGHEYLHAAFYPIDIGWRKSFRDYYEHAAIYDWALSQSKAWNYHVAYYRKKYNYYSGYLYHNPFSPSSVGFFVYPTKPI